MATLLPDQLRKLRLTLRQLRKSPGFTVTVVLTLSFGIGATTAIFSLIEGVLLRPLPFRDPDRLVLLGDHVGSGHGTGVTAREIRSYAEQTSAFESMGGYINTAYELSGGVQPEEVGASRVSASLMPTLGVQPLMGRVFTTHEEDAHQPLAVISYALWMNRFHNDPAVIGKTVDLDRKTYSIVGVMPRSFEFPVHTGQLDQTEVWVPLSLTAEELTDENAGNWGYRLIARLKSGVTTRQAADDAERVSGQIMHSFPANMAAIHIRGDVHPLKEQVVGDARPLLRTLFVAVAVVLLIACINVAALLVVRAMRRRREYAVRLALGAQTAGILRESIAEGLILSSCGGLLGLGFAAAIIRIALRLLPRSMPRIDSLSIDGRVVAFALLVSVITGALCSIAPAFAALRTDLISSLKDGARTGSGGQSHAWLRSSLVVSEIAIALVLLTISGAFLRSFQKMRAVDPGFRAEHVLVAGYQLPIAQYPTYAASNAFYREVVERLSHKPGVVAAGVSDNLPTSGGGGASAYTVEAMPLSQWKLEFASFGIIDSNYFKAMGIPVLEGRTFTDSDRADAPPVIVVNTTMAKHCWPNQRAIGQRLHAGNPKKGLPWATVVGVVADTKLGSPDQPDADQWYIPMTQPETLFGAQNTTAPTRAASGYIVMRTGLAPDAAVATLRSTIASIDPSLALDPVQTMSDVVSDVEAPRRFNTDLITAFAIAALLLCVTGIYAVVAFAVSLRSQEIAIRMALGAERKRIARLVLASGLRVAIAGCVLGIIGSLAVSRLIASYLFAVSPTDPLIYAAAALTMIAVTLIASAVPARRAASADPVDALRSN